jgi:glucose-1-phosphate adenylyltransferase
VGDLCNTLLDAATVIHEGVRIHNSVIRREAVIQEVMELNECVIMGDVCAGRD